MSRKNKLKNIIRGIEQDMNHIQEQYANGDITQDIYTGRIEFKKAQIGYINREISKLD